MRDTSNRQSYAGNEGCFSGCILPLFMLPFMIAIAPIVIVCILISAKNTKKV